MWNYNQQIWIRWIAFILSFAFTGGMAFYISGQNPEFLTTAGLKAWTTQISVALEYMPDWIWAAVFAAIVALQLTGVPAVIIFACLYPIAGFYMAFFTILLCQIFSSFLAIRNSWKKFNQNRLNIKFSPALKNMLPEIKENSASFAFWSRIYFAFPLRTIDFLTPLVSSDEKNITADFLPLSSAIALRMIIPALWVESLLKLVKNFSPDPGADAAMFLAWSSALVAYTLIPRIPELFICPSKIKGFLTELEKYEAPADKKNLDDEFVLSPAEKKAIVKPDIKKPPVKNAASAMQTRTI